MAELTAMRCEELSTQQYRERNYHIGPMKSYLIKLIRRMNKRSFPSDDQLFRKVLAASAAIHDLDIFVHYGSVGPPALSPQKRPDE